MSSSKVARSRVTEVADAPTPDALASALAAGLDKVVSGEIVVRQRDGQISIDYPQNPLGPLPARTLVEDLHLGARVLLAFDGGDPARPIVLGIIHDRARAEGQTIHLKAKRIVLEAQDELLLQCGEGSFAARRDGNVNVKGKNVVSRATRTNKVRGATVLIN
jgi:hypothetical protein